MHDSVQPLSVGHSRAISDQCESDDLGNPHMGKSREIKVLSDTRDGVGCSEAEV